MISAERLVNTFNEHLGEDGSVELRRYNRATGEVIDDENDSDDKVMAEADYKMRTGQLARLLSVLNPEEKLEWAVARKVEGNDMFKEGRFDKAIQRYLDCTVGLDFGTTPEQAEKARTVIQLPVLTNLAACYLGKKEWQKAVQFCDQAIGVDDKCIRAYERRCKAYIQLGNLSQAKSDLDRVEALDPESTSTLKRLFRKAIEDRRQKLEQDKLLAKRMLSKRLDDDDDDDDDDEEEEEEDDDDERVERQDRISMCTILKMKMQRFLQFRIDPPVQFD